MNAGIADTVLVFVDWCVVVRKIAMQQLVRVLVAVASCAVALACAPAGTPERVTIGKSSHVCVIFNGKARAYFTPVVDQLTRLEFNGCTCQTLFWVFLNPVSFTSPVALHTHRGRGLLVHSPYVCVL
jgi:hypothetical protein